MWQRCCASRVCVFFGGRITRKRKQKKEQLTEKSRCVHTCGCLGEGGLPTYLNRGVGPALCFSFRRRSVVLKQWQASQWKLALTSNYILPACQGLWDYRLTGLQSALCFASLIPSLPFVPLISAFRPVNGSIIFFLIFLSYGPVLNFLIILSCI